MKKNFRPTTKFCFLPSSVKHGDSSANGYILEHTEVRAQAMYSRVLAGCASAGTLALGFVEIQPSSISAHAWSISLLCSAYSALL
jgi:hypothetical protein